MGHVVEEILVIDGSNRLRLEVDNVDMLVGDVHNDNLAFVEHSEEVDNVRVLMLEENFAFSIDMHDALIGSRIDDFAENVGIVEGSGETEYLGDGVFQFQLVMLLQKHSIKYISTQMQI